MKKILRLFSGLNAASIMRGLRLGPGEAVRASLASHAAAHPFESEDSLLQSRVREKYDLIPTVALGDVLDAALGNSRRNVRLELAKYEDGRMPINDLVAVLAILSAENPREVLEIGTYMGHTTKAMAENLPTALIHTIDLPPDFSEPKTSNPEIPKDDFHLIRRRVVGREFKGTPEESRIRQHFGDTAKMNFQTIGRPTFFFIDGSHTYEYCKQDSEKCLALCRGAGTFLWHDCNQWHDGVINFISEWRAAGRDICKIAGTSVAYWMAKSI